MFSWIPWDVRCAGLLLIATMIAAIFGSVQVIFVGLYAMLCGYILVSTFYGEEP